MTSVKKIENLIIMILLIGTLISISLVLVGGLFYLSQHGFQLVKTDFVMPKSQTTNIKIIWQSIFSFTPLNMINLGLLVLVFIQILRVALLAWFYYSIQDKWFTFISIFILLILLYGFLWR